MLNFDGALLLNGRCGIMETQHNENVSNQDCTLSSIIKMFVAYWAGVALIIGALFVIYGLS